MRYYPFVLASLLIACAPLKGAMLHASVGIPSGVPGFPGTIEDGGADNQVYEVRLGSVAIAKAQADYGILRNYVYSNTDDTSRRESIAVTHFDDWLFVNSPIAGTFTVGLLVEGEITFTHTNPPTNQQSFYSQWAIQNIGIGTSECFHQGTFLNVPALPLQCSMTVPVSVGLNTIYISGTLIISTFGPENVGEMDLFNSSKVVGWGVFDGGSPVNAIITSESGTIYPTSAVPEPATMTLCALGAVVFLIRRKTVR